MSDKAPRSSDTQRQAACACGQLTVTVRGDPYVVLACTCTQCQRRTGSSFGLSAYFYGSQVLATTGRAQNFLRKAESGRDHQFRFCPRCGSTVYWTPPGDGFQNSVGIAAGCFADATFPAPQLITWTKHQAHWLTFPADIPATENQPDKLPDPKVD